MNETKALKEIVLTELPIRKKWIMQCLLYNMRLPNRKYCRLQHERHSCIRRHLCPHGSNSLRCESFLLQRRRGPILEMSFAKVDINYAGIWATEKIMFVTSRRDAMRAIRFLMEPNEASPLALNGFSFSSRPLATLVKTRQDVSSGHHSSTFTRANTREPLLRSQRLNGGFMSIWKIGSPYFKMKMRLRSQTIGSVAHS